MVTRADFWLKEGDAFEWLGSVAYDGYEWDGGQSEESEGTSTIKAACAQEFREVVATILKDRDDVTLPEDGWPWPWKTSNTSDYGYVWENGVVTHGDRNDWPEMEIGKMATPGSKRSGIMALWTQ